MKRTVRSKFGEVSVRNEGVVVAKVLHGVEIDVEKAEIYHNLVEHLTKNEPHCTVIDLSGISGITPEARKKLQQQSSEWGKTIAVALVSSTFTSRVIGNFFLSINKPSYPVRIFSNQIDAHQWALNEYSKFITKLAS